MIHLQGQPFLSKKALQTAHIGLILYRLHVFTDYMSITGAGMVLNGAFQAESHTRQAVTLTAQWPADFAVGIIRSSNHAVILGGPCCT